MHACTATMFAINPGRVLNGLDSAGEREFWGGQIVPEKNKGSVMSLVLPQRDIGIGSFP